MKILKKWWVSLIIVLAIILIWLLIKNFNSEENTYPYNQTNYSENCTLHYNQIDNELQTANYCSIDSDCKVLPLGGMYVEFGCYHYINKDVDGEALYNKMDNYWNKCTRIINDCGPGPAAQCVNGKCVEKQENCVKEGESFGMKLDKTCCEGLISAIKYVYSNNTCIKTYDVFVCIDCGNGICGAGENQCNCPSDCNESIKHCEITSDCDYLNESCSQEKNPIISCIRPYSESGEHLLGVCEVKCE